MAMKKIRVSEAAELVLDWLVAKCEGGEFVAEPGVNGIGMKYEATRYSTNWAQGGPIVERERIQLRPERGTEWRAYSGLLGPDMTGATPLIAAMRCFCASKLGDEIEVPEELL